MSIDKRLRWRCRRGTRELDLILERFLIVAGSTLTEAEEATFGRLLEEADQNILDWVAGRAPPPAGPELAALLQRIRVATGGPGVDP